MSSAAIRTKIELLQAELKQRGETQYLYNVYRAMLTFSCIVQLRKPELGFLLPKDIVRLICNFVWLSHEDDAWDTGFILKRQIPVNAALKLKHDDDLKCGQIPWHRWEHKLHLRVHKKFSNCLFDVAEIEKIHAFYAKYVSLDLDYAMLFPSMYVCINVPDKNVDGEFWKFDFTDVDYRKYVAERNKNKCIIHPDQIATLDIHYGCDGELMWSRGTHDIDKACQRVSKRCNKYFANIRHAYLNNDSLLNEYKTFDIDYEKCMMWLLLNRSVIFEAIWKLCVKRRIR